MEKKTARWIKFRLSALVVLGLSALISGCVSGRPDPGRPAGSFASPETALRVIAETAPPQGGTLKAIASIQVTAPTGAYPLKLAVLLRRKAMMRVEAIPVLGPPNFYLVIHGGRLKALLPDKNEFYSGRATRENIAMFLPLRIDVESLVSLLMGVPPPVAGKDLRREGVMEGEVYRIDIRDGVGLLQSIRVHRADGLVKGVDIHDGAGKALYRIRYEDPLRSGGFVTPRKIAIVSEEDKTTLTLRYAELEWTFEEDESPFELKVPPGVKEGAFP